MSRALVGMGFVMGLGAVVLAVFSVAASLQPDTLVVSRSTLIAAQPQDIAPLISDFHQFVRWSPWAGLDPDQVSELSDPSSGVGAWYSWSGNDEVGSGGMLLTAVSALRVEQDLHFSAPVEMDADVVFELSVQGEQTQVTWAMSQPASFATKVGMLLMDMDAMLGADFDKGLHALSGLAEGAARERADAEQAARVAQEATQADVQQVQPLTPAAP